MFARALLAVIAEHHSHRSVLRLRGELDVSSAEWLHRVISTALERDPPVLALDMSGLDFADCAGLSVLVRAHKRQAERGHELIITGATRVVRRLLRLTELDAYLHLRIPEPDADWDRPASSG